MTARGQAIVEFALVFPILAFAGLGLAEAGFLLASQEDQDRATSTVAVWAASHPDADWHAVAASELPDCDVDVVASSDPPDLFTVTARCTYHPRVTANLWTGLPITTEQSAAIVVAQAPNPSPVPS